MSICEFKSHLIQPDSIKVVFRKAQAINYDARDNGSVTQGMLKEEQP